MKTLLAAICILGFASLALADIQDPPSNDHGPTRKLSRGLANLVFSFTELPVNIAKVNTDEGNSTAASYGVVRGVGRSLVRIPVGIFEIITFPFPLNHGTYAPLLPSDTRYIHAGYPEFPPELGYESKYPYVRQY